MEDPMQWVGVMRNMNGISVAALMVAIPEARQFRNRFPEHEDEINRCFIREHLEGAKCSTPETISHAARYSNYSVLDEAIRTYPEVALKHLRHVDSRGLDIVAKAVEEGIISVPACSSARDQYVDWQSLRFWYSPKQGPGDTPKYRVLRRLADLFAGERHADDCMWNNPYCFCWGYYECSCSECDCSGYDGALDRSADHEEEWILKHPHKNDHPCDLARVHQRQLRQSQLRESQLRQSQLRQSQLRREEKESRKKAKKRWWTEMPREQARWK